MLLLTLEDGSNVEVALPRTVDPGTDGSSPAFDPSLSFAEAARGRDLRINAMAWDPLTGDLLDPHSGQRDIADGILRATDPECFGQDPLRGLRTARYKYIRNFLPNRPHLQPNRYKDGKDIIKALRKAHAAGTLNKTQELLFTPTRPKEELYDLKNDPFEIHNLAADSKHQIRLKNFRKRLNNWMKALKTNRL